MAKPKPRRVLTILGIGCATVVVIVLGFAGWTAIQVRAVNRPVVVDGVHPFRSAAKRDRYLASYDARAARWPVPSRGVFVDTSWGETFVRISGREAVERLNRVAPEIETELFPDCGHDLRTFQTDRFNRRVLEFLDETP